MKRNILHIIWAAAAVLLSACTQEEQFLTDEIGIQPFAITITDGGYASAASTAGLQKVATRATESGYRTDFTAGDACGLYILRPGDEEGSYYAAYSNVKLTAASTDDSLTWQADADVTLAGGLTDERYFLYYPYQGDMSGKTDTTATDDAGFFAPLIDDWQPEADQSNYAQGYTASDLMTSEGSASQGTDGSLSLSFSMSHRMALAVIEMPKTVYQFTNNTGGEIPDYTVSTAAEFAAEAVPYLNSDGTYRYLVCPQTDTTSLTGSYDEGMKVFTVTPDGIEAGSYKTYKVDSAPTETKEHYLQRGDFLLADGNIVGKDSLTEEQKASVSAIVFWTPSETDATDRDTPARLTDDKIMAADYPDCTHGLAVAVDALAYNNSSTMYWQPWGSFEHVKSWQAGQENYKPTADGFVSISSGDGANDNINRIYGYQNTVVLRAYNKYCTNNGNESSVVQPVAALDAFACSAPAGSTGWFLPSVKELHMLCYKDVDNVAGEGGTYTRDIVKTSLSAVGGDDLESTSFYWSSSENDLDSVSAFDVYFYDGNVGLDFKYFTFRARAVCAF